MKSKQFVWQNMKKEYIEIKLDEADSFAERTKESLSHEEVFARLRAFCSRDCRGGEAVDHSRSLFDFCEDDDR